MFFNHQAFIAAITAFSLLSPASSRALIRRDGFCAREDIVNDKGEHWDGNPSQLVESTFHLADNKKASPEWLRIMPLGASITAGIHSTPEDGYRKALRDHLISLGHQINMVGSM
jgi:hypothetical protein